MTTTNFTVAHGLTVQAEQMEGWKPKLSAALWDDLVQTVAEENQLTLKLNPPNGYAVFRGSDISNFIANWKPKS